jgi:hypothetical protein
MVAPLVIASKTETHFEYVFKSVADLRVETHEDLKTGKLKVSAVLVDDEPIKPTQRFWTSLFARYGFNKAFFKYFSHVEVFERIAQVGKNDAMRLCIERGENEKGEPLNRMLSVSNPKKPLVSFEELHGVLERYQSKNVSYADGIVESHHVPVRGAMPFEVVGDAFGNEFVMHTPIDGYGKPNIYLSMLREVCQNGIIALSKTFQSGVSLGKVTDDVTHSITRALDGFNNDDGFDALRKRIESATRSWASVYESTQAYNLLLRLMSRQELLGGMGAVGSSQSVLIHKHLSSGPGGLEDIDQIGSPIMKAFRNMTGDTSKLYGLANIDALSIKRQRTLPIECKMYDLLNFLTEAATHWAEPSGARALSAMVGGMLATEYDLENTCDQYGEFADFLIDSKLASGVTGGGRVILVLWGCLLLNWWLWGRRTMMSFRLTIWMINR